jgi:hypothetical protein
LSMVETAREGEQGPVDGTPQASELAYRRLD